MSLDGLSFSALIAELNNSLAGGRIEKIFQPSNYSLLLWIRQNNHTYKLSISANPAHPHMHITPSAPDNPASPPAFCMLLRKHLEDGRIAAIEQHSLDRIAKISIDVRAEKGLLVTKQLIIELMGKHSNIIFVQEDLIIDAIRRIGPSVNRHRQVLPRKSYVYPPGQLRLNLHTTPIHDFFECLLQADCGSLEKALIHTAIGLGPITAREIVWRAGLPADIQLSQLEPADIRELQEAISSILTPLKANILNPTIMTDADNRLKGIAAFRLEHLSGQCAIHNFATMSEAVEFSLNISPLPASRNTPEQAFLTKRVTDEISRLSRKHTLLSQELATAKQADVFRQYGDLLMANLYAIPPGQAMVTVPNLFTETLDNISIEIDPELTILENANFYYSKYNKQKRAQQSLSEQLAHCFAERTYLEGVLLSLEHAEKNSEIVEIRKELATAGYIKDLKKRCSTPPSTPLKVTAPDFTILIGKNNLQNDLVTFKQAQPDDLWFHTKDIPGSHVILRTKQLPPPDEAIKTAAHFAAYFSKAKHSSNTPVDYTKRRFVKKPSGAKPGFVIYEHQTTLYVTPDENLLKNLLNDH